jgi:hypothetical protein
MERLAAQELARLSPESERAFREAFVEHPATGAIRFTWKGFAEYGSRFARARIDINRMRTRDAFREAPVRRANRGAWVMRRPPAADTCK